MVGLSPEGVSSPGMAAGLRDEGTVRPLNVRVSAAVGVPGAGAAAGESSADVSTGRHAHAVAKHLIVDSVTSLVWTSLSSYSSCL